MKSWSQSTKWKINPKYYPVLVGIVIIGVVLVVQQLSFFYPSRVDDNLDDASLEKDLISSNNEALESEQFRILSPRKYQLINSGDDLNIQIDRAYLDLLEVKISKLDISKSNKPEIYSYNLGLQKFNSSSINVNTKNYSNGQYKIILLNNKKIVGESAIFTISNESNQINISSPVNMQVLNSSEDKIAWSFSPDIYFINIYLENDNERFVIAQNIVNTGEFIWDFTDRFGRGIVNGEYVLILEDNFSKKEFGKIRFKVER